MSQSNIKDCKNSGNNINSTTAYGISNGSGSVTSNCYNTAEVKLSNYSVYGGGIASSSGSLKGSIIRGELNFLECNESNNNTTIYCIT